MGKADEVTREYMSDTDIFADAFNFCIYDGEHVIDGENLKREDKLIPVITVVIYFGLKDWDGAIKLSDLFEETDERLLQYVPDYKIIIINPKKIADEDFKKFDTDLGKVLKFLKYCGENDKLEKVLTEDIKYKKLSRKAALVLNICANLEMNIGEKDEEEV